MPTSNPVTPPTYESVAPDASAVLIDRYRHPKRNKRIWFAVLIAMFTGVIIGGVGVASIFSLLASGTPLISPAKLEQAIMLESMSLELFTVLSVLLVVLIALGVAFTIVASVKTLYDNDEIEAAKTTDRRKGSAAQTAPNTGTADRR